MKTYYLKFANEAEANSILYTEYPLKIDEDLNVTETYTVPNYINIDIIGTIYKPTGKMLMGDNGKYPEMAALDGWHVNVLADDAPELETYVVTPSNPIRIWA